MRNATKCSARHIYEDVFYVSIQNSKTFTIHFVSDSRSFTYITPLASVAASIVNAINQRRALAIQKANVKNPEKKTATLKQPLNTTPRNSTLRTSLNTEVKGESPSSSSFRGGEDSDSGDELTGTEGQTVAAEVIAAAVPKPTTRAPVRQSVQQGRQLALENILHSPQQDSSKAITLFMKNFSSQVKHPSTILGVTREFMDSLIKHVYAKHPELRREGVLPVDIETAVEAAVIIPTHRRLMDCLKKDGAERERIIQENTQCLQTQPQSFFGIKREYECPNNWDVAVCALALLDHQPLPIDKLETLCRTAQSIHDLYVRNRQNQMDKGLVVPEADTLPPGVFFNVFVYVVTKAAIDFRDSTGRYCWGLCEVEALNGDGGYYLTVFEAAVEFIFKFDRRPTAKSDALP